ncbi:unnamed protein product [Bathycoccus prasinos]
MGKKKAAAKNINGVPVILLEDLAMRFVLNVPAEELANPNRILFLIELAWWHYEDFSRKNDATLPKFSLSNFAELLYLTIPQLKRFAPKAKEIYGKFVMYKFSVPCAGAILLNPDMDKVILVKGMAKNSSWGFPKGKINDGEKMTTEVEEEIGVNISSLIDENEFVFHTKKGVTKQETTLYIIPGVSEQTHFATYTREEISQICWHPIGNLDPNIKTSKRVKGVRYFGVHEFYYGLTQWIKSARKKNIKIQNSIDAPMNSPGQFIAKQYVESDDEDDDYGGGFTSIEALENRFMEQAAENVYGKYDERNMAAFRMESFSSLKNFSFDRQAIMNAI